MKAFFILGRNPALSRAEILFYLQARQRSFKEVFFEQNFLVLDLPDDEIVEIQKFGGTIKYGVIEYLGTQKDFFSFMEKNELVPADKFSYAVYGNLSSEILKEKFKKDRKKAAQKHGEKKLKLEGGSFAALPNTDFSLFLYNFNSKLFYGRVTQEYDHKQLEERDMNKPVRRQELAISPRLAKILLNLSGAKIGTLTLDPFCGVGGILQEALILGIKCRGQDLNKEAIEGARKNLEWLKSKYHLNTAYELEFMDSIKTPDLQFGAIATETPLGKLLKKRPNDNEARTIINSFENSIIPVLRRLKMCKRQNARIAITFPIIGPFSVNLGKVAPSASLRIIAGPFNETRPDQFISRQIVVLE